MVGPVPFVPFGMHLKTLLQRVARSRSEGRARARDAMTLAAPLSRGSIVLQLSVSHLRPKCHFGITSNCCYLRHVIITASTATDNVTLRTHCLLVSAATAHPHPRLSPSLVIKHRRALLIGWRCADLKQKLILHTLQISFPSVCPSNFFSI
jgi:hypothetical protein